MANFRKDFPIYEKKSDLVYLDSASTALKPRCVIDSLIEYYGTYSANVHRGFYPIAEKSTESYENARKIVSTFIGARDEEVIFTSGTTESLNLVCSMLLKNGLIKKGSKVLLSELEHHSNIVPWQEVTDLEIDYIKIDENLSNYIGKPYDVVSLTLASNVIGAGFDIKDLRKTFPKSIIVADAAQLVPHKKINLASADIDFLAFSGHKLYGPTGVGVLYINERFGKTLIPSKFGGGMIENVEKEKSIFTRSVDRFEAGTPPIAEAIALAEAISFINSSDFNLVYEDEINLTNYLLRKLRELDEVIIYNKTEIFVPVVSFNIKDIHSHDIAYDLGTKNVSVRAGHHCAQILHTDGLNISSSVRASLGMYNTIQDIDMLVKSLKEIIRNY